MVNRSKNLELIQALRGFASLLVVFYHATSNSIEVLHRPFLGNVFYFGGAGVDIFFVLSGFIITYSNIHKAGKPAGLFPFLRRRAIRIFPAYWIVITVFLAWQFLLPQFYKTNFDTSIANFLSTYLLLPGHKMINGVSWTLSYELYFYLLFALMFLLPSKKWVFAIFICYVLMLVGLPLAGYHFDGTQTLVDFICSPINVEFFFGILAASIISRMQPRLALPFVIFGIVGFLAGAFLFDTNIQVIGNGFNRVLLFGVPAFFIIAGLVKYELDTDIKLHNVMLSLGEASYSLYLIHLPIVVASLKLIALSGISNPVVIHILLLVLIVITCWISILFYKLVEKPVITRLNKISVRPFRKEAVKKAVG